MFGWRRPAWREWMSAITWCAVGNLEDVGWLLPPVRGLWGAQGVTRSMQVVGIGRVSALGRRQRLGFGTGRHRRPFVHGRLRWFGAACVGLLVLGCAAVHWSGGCCAKGAAPAGSGVRNG